MLRLTGVTHLRSRRELLLPPQDLVVGPQAVLISALDSGVGATLTLLGSALRTCRPRPLALHGMLQPGTSSTMHTTFTSTPTNRLVPYACRHDTQQSHQDVRQRSQALQSASGSSRRSVDVSRRHVLLGLVSGLALSSSSSQAVAGLIDEQQADKVFESANQSVVSIADYKVSNGTETSEGTGSGFVWDTYGHVVTNYHCIASLATDRLGAQV